MSDDARFDQIVDDLRYIRGRVDEAVEALAVHKQDVEHRLTKVEVKSGAWGAVGGFLSGLAIKFWWR